MNRLINTGWKRGVFLFSLLAYQSFSVVQAAMDCHHQTQIPLLECETLVALYHDTEGSHWFNNSSHWNEIDTPCDWFGITCDEGHVSEIKLYNNGLNGFIPDLNALIFLKVLRLNYNKLTGPMPNLSDLIHLEWLDLSNNQLNGPIPNLKTLVQLEWLDLHNNQLNGPIPNLSSLTRLEWLDLHGNHLTGSIPNLSLLTQLEWIDLRDNHLNESLSDLNILTIVFSPPKTTEEFQVTIPKHQEVFFDD